MQTEEMSSNAVYAGAVAIEHENALSVILIPRGRGHEHVGSVVKENTISHVVLTNILYNLTALTFQKTFRSRV